MEVVSGGDGVCGRTGVRGYVAGGPGRVAVWEAAGGTRNAQDRRVIGPTWTWRPNDVSQTYGCVRGPGRGAAVINAVAGPGLCFVGAGAGGDPLPW